MAMTTNPATRRSRQASRRTSLLAAAFVAFHLPAIHAQETAQGATVFDSACAVCHGANGRGGQNAPSLLARVAKDDDAALTAFLRSGNPERGMPPAAVTAAQMPMLIE